MLWKSISPLVCVSSVINPQVYVSAKVNRMRHKTWIEMNVTVNKFKKIKWDLHNGFPQNTRSLSKCLPPIYLHERINIVKQCSVLKQKKKRSTKCDKRWKHNVTAYIVSWDGAVGSLAL